MVKKRHRKASFFVILFFTLLPLLLFPLESIFFHVVYDAPSVTNGLLDLSGYDLTRKRALPLDGKWEFYADRWIVSEGVRPAAPDLMAEVPQSRNRYATAGGRREKEGRDSYRILLKNCPENVSLVSYIPNINARYRIYLNGELIAGRGIEEMPDLPLGGNVSSIHAQAHYYQFRRGMEATGGGAELVVELSSPYINGLYMTPVLTEQYTDITRSDMRYLFTAALIGILFVCIGCVACLLFLRDKSLSSAALLALDLLVLLRIIQKNEFLFFLQNVLPFWENLINSVLQIVILFLPVIFLLCARQLSGEIKVSRKMILFTVLYELAFAPGILVCVLTGRPLVQLLLCVASYLPFVFILRALYKSVRQEGTLMVSAILLFILSSMIATTFSSSGLLVMNISLFAPASFSISVFLQLVLYMRRNLELQNRSIETENLRLRLRESETDLMLSQIKPHFLYNTLTAIHTLCTDEPETAAEAVLKFSNFLRTNMKFINSKELIPFARELEHIQNYADIEKLRFQDRLTLRFEIQATDFRVPPLTIQPLVENAIRHGACKNILGGTVTVKTYETARQYHIEILDDGPGFDTKILKKMTPDSLGIRNITFRLEQAVNADVLVSSQPEQGTLVQVLLPKEASFEKQVL